MKRRELALLLRQVTAHDAFVLRRAARELTAAGLVRVGSWLPGAAWAALRIHPGARDAHRLLAARAEARGDAGAAARHRDAFEHLAHNTLETSVLGALRTTLAWRRSRRQGGGPSEDLEKLLAEGRFGDAEAALRKSDAPLGSRVDGLLHLAAAAARAGDRAREERLLDEAGRLDGGRADLWLALGRRALASGVASLAEGALERAADLDPLDVAVWSELGDACEHAAPERAREAWGRALALDPGCDAAIVGLERLSGSGHVAHLRLSVSGTRPAALEVGESVEIEVGVQVSGGAAGLHVLEPCGHGLLCEPRGRIPVAEGNTSLTVRVTALRPDAVAGGRPWRLELALASGARVERLSLAFGVPDREPGEIHYTITEDHELYDEREATDAEAARKTLVDKSRFAEQVANEQGAAWTHMVDVGSLHLVPWAARQSRGDTWQAVADASAEHLIEAVANGNDLGLHCHAFHDPGTDVFCHGFDPESDRVTTPAAFLETPLPQRGFWSRAFPALGDAALEGSRAWATWRGIGALEALGRLGDPRFRVTCFRAGSFDFGEDAPERARSLALLQRLELLADSDVPKPRLYHRPMARATYPVDGDPRQPAAGPERMRALEIRAEFNIEADFLSDVGVLNGYVDGRIDALRTPEGGALPGVHVICAMTHDKFINWRMGRQWDSLEAGYGDWATIRDHLAHVARAHPEVRFSRTRDAVLAWYERYTPRLLAWRDEEVVELAAPDAGQETYRYVLRLVGRDIPVSAEQPREVTVLPPAWLFGRVREAWIERDGERWPARRSPVEPGPLRFRVDARDAAWELVVAADAVDGAASGITAERAGDTLRLRSSLPYRRASVDVPAALAADGVRRRVREVALQAVDGVTGVYEATLSA